MWPCDMWYATCHVSCVAGVTCCVTGVTYYIRLSGVTGVTCCVTGVTYYIFVSPPVMCHRRNMLCRRLNTTHLSWRFWSWEKLFGNLLVCSCAQYILQGVFESKRTQVTFVLGQHTNVWQLVSLAAWFESCQAAKKFKLPSWQAAKLSSCKTLKLTSWQAVKKFKLSSCQAAKLSSCKTLKLQNSQAEKLSSCQAAKLSNIQTSKLWSCKTLKL